MTLEFKARPGMPNLLASGLDYEVSYNPTANHGGPETALMVDNKYFILNGDHRESYSKCNNLTECKSYFCTHQDQLSFWSDSE